MPPTTRRKVTPRSRSGYSSKQTPVAVIDLSWTEEEKEEKEEEEQEKDLEERPLATATAGDDGRKEGQVELVVPTLCEVGKLLLEDIMNHEGDDPEGIIKAMQSLHDAMKYVAAAGSDYRQNRRDAFEVGGQGIIISKMKKFIASPIIQRRGCDLLKFIAAESGVSYDCDLCIIMAGGAEAIINAMNVHKEDFSVQYGGIGALVSLTARFNRNEIKELTDRLVSRFNVVSIVEDAMTNFTDYSELQLRGCRFLRNLSQNSTLLTKYKKDFMKAVGVVGFAVTIHGNGGDNDDDHHVDANNNEKKRKRSEDILEYGGGFMKRVFSQCK